MLDPKTVEEMKREAGQDFRGVPIGKIICIAKAGWKAYQCETGTGTNCIPTFIKEVEACLKG